MPLRPVALSVALQIGVPRQAVVIAAGVLAVLLTIEILLTLGYSVVKSNRQKRQTPIRESLRDELLTRLYRPAAPEWEQWVESLSEEQRAVLEALLDEYLRELDGADATQLAALGEALGITQRAHRHLKHGSYTDRLQALTWLALLQDAPAIEVLKEHCTGTPKERAAAVRVLHESGHPEIGRIGIDLLLSDNPNPFSIFGVDTLYRAAEKDPSHLFERAAADFVDWEPQLQQQVLLSCRYLRTLVGDAELSWLVEALNSPAERTRAEALKTLGGFGWHPTLLEGIDLQSLVNDSSPLVRTSAYQMFGEWGDETAIDLLRFAGMADPNARARVAAARALIAYDGEYDFSIPDQLAAWSWAAEQASYDAVVRDISAEATMTGGSS